MFYARTLLLVLLLSPVLFQACSRDEDGRTTVNLFSLEDDKRLGEQLAAEIAADPATYPLLDPAAYPTAYAELERIKAALLNSGAVKYKDEFVWQLRIIRDDSVLNAFCAPGGYIYVYTGLIKFLDKESELAGVLGHEIAHADLRHTTDALTRQYGVQLLFDIVLGNNQGAIGQLAQGLLGLGYSRGNETQSDEASVRMLCATDWEPTGTAGFFQKLIDEGTGGGAPEFLSTHPNPDNRVSDINAKATELNCPPGEGFATRYEMLKAALP
ncbi:MAG: M48 family metalloprotease [Sphingobacteriia bacterium]|jgi:predicted Zn-dependent protease